VGDAREVRGAAQALAGEVDALWLLPDPQLFSPEMVAYLLDVAVVQHKIALFGFDEEHTRGGALASLAIDVPDVGRRAARLAAAIAGRPPARRLPVPEPKPSPGALTINRKTARRLGVEIPEGVLRYRAQRVFE
jgi:ABC-type uncharacterized transport system substrate-binding protein